MDHFTRIAERVKNYGYGLLITDVPPIQNKAVLIDNKGSGFKGSEGKIYEDTLALRDRFYAVYGDFFKGREQPVDWSVSFWQDIPGAIFKHAIKAHQDNPDVAIDIVLREDKGYELKLIQPLKTVPPEVSQHWTRKLPIENTYFIHQHMPYEDSKRALHNVLEDVEDRRSFILYSEYTAEQIYKHETPTYYLEKALLNELYFFDFHKYVCEGDLYCSRWHKPPIEGTQIPLTPIETTLKKALDEAGLNYQEQFLVGRFRPDFIVNDGAKKLIVEADGVRYHVPERDARRDAEIKKEFGLSTLRLAGSEIYGSPEECIKKIKDALNDTPVKRFNYKFEDFEALDVSQKKAVNAKAGSLKVVAPAGSGKTKVLINRVVKLLNEGVSPDGILCLAFNRSARDTMAERLSSLKIPVKKASESDGFGVTVSTLHALGHSIIKENGITEVLPSRKINALVKKALDAQAELPVVRGQDPIRIFFESNARVKAGLIAPRDVSMELESQKGEILKVPCEAAIRHYDRSLVKAGATDFPNQIYSALGALAGDYTLRQKYQIRFTHILVDEYQDLAPAQVALIRVLGGKGQNVFVVGDDDQLIYSFAHVEPENFEAFSNAFPKITEVPLIRNYRSSKSVVEHSQRLIQHNKSRIKKNVEAASDELGNTVVDASESLDDQVSFIVRRLEKLKQESNFRYSDSAILSRYNAPLLLVASRLDRAGIPRSALPNVKLFSLPVSQTLRSYLEIIFSPETCQADHYSRVLNKPNRYLRNEFLKLLQQWSNPFQLLGDLVKTAKTGVDESNPTELIQLRAALGEKWREDHLSKFLKDVRELNELSNKVTSSELITELLTRVQIAEREESASKGSEQISDNLILDIIVEDAKRFEKIDEFLFYFEERDAYERGERDQSDLEHTESVSEKTKNEEQVSLRSIHKAKGLEWEHVFYFDLSNKNNSGVNKPLLQENNEQEEERRIAYVGMTRAIKNLFVTTRENEVSRFLWEAVMPMSLWQERDPGVAAERLQKQLRDSVNRAKTQLDNYDLAEGDSLIREIDLLKQEKQSLESEKEENDRDVPVGWIKASLSKGHTERTITQKSQRLQLWIDKKALTISEKEKRVVYLQSPAALVELHKLEDAWKVAKLEQRAFEMQFENIRQVVGIKKQ